MLSPYFMTLGGNLVWKVYITHPFCLIPFGHFNFFRMMGGRIKILTGWWRIYS